MNRCGKNIVGPEITLEAGFPLPRAVGIVDLVRERQRALQRFSGVLFASVISAEAAKSKNDKEKWSWSVFSRVVKAESTQKVRTIDAERTEWKKTVFNSVIKADGIQWQRNVYKHVVEAEEGYIVASGRNSRSRCLHVIKASANKQNEFIVCSDAIDS